MKKKCYTLEKVLVFVFILLTIFFMSSLYGIDFKEKLSIDQARKDANQLIFSLQQQGYHAIKLIVKRNHYFINIKINGKHFQFCLDTGALKTVLRYDNFKQLHLSSSSYRLDKRAAVSSSPTDHNKKLFYTKADTFQVGNVIFKPWIIKVNKRLKLYSLLGADFLRFTRAIIICRFGILMISSSQKSAKNIQTILKKYKYAKLFRNENKRRIAIKQLNNSDSISLTYGRLIVPMVYGDIRTYAMIDTGSPYTSLQYSFLQNKTFINTKVYKYHMLNFAKERELLQTIVFSNLAVGRLKLQNRSVWVSTMMGSNLVGLDILVHHNGIIDFGNQMIYMHE